MSHVCLRYSAQLSRSSSQLDTWQTTLRIVQLNVSLFVLNMLVPAVPLPGSRILADMLLIGGVRTDTTYRPITVTLLLCSAASLAASIVIGVLRSWGFLLVRTT